ncbi:agamous-like MADS-box protein AGL62 [Primulina huaijiensis]|uniref:agamous-like MADS-box protein AGL62 n=1 Tax=Primulina huaijiensis TaxID=1492673 RepID=UPI003CC764C2
MSTSGNNEENPTRKGKGRRKVTMEKMENESNLQVTFSKRRSGLFKKASELSTRCGTESALVVFSPGGKPYSFGHPNVERVISRFLGDQNDHNFPPPTDQLRSLEAERNMIANSTAELNQALDQLDLAKNQSKELEQRVGKIIQIKEFNYHQLDQLQREVLDFKNKFGTDGGKDKSFTAGTPSNFLGPNPNHGTTTNFQLVEPGINIFGSNAPLDSNDPLLAGTSTNYFLASPSGLYSSSGFVNPNAPLSTNAIATIPMNSTENESSGIAPGNNVGGASKET